MKRLLMVAAIAATLASPALAQETLEVAEQGSFVEVAPEGSAILMPAAIFFNLPQGNADGRSVMILLPGLKEGESMRPFIVERYVPSESALHPASTFVLDDGSKLDLGLSSAFGSFARPDRSFEWRHRGIAGIRWTITWF